MKPYWDYSEKERSEMTEEQVRILLDYELMAEGVLKPKPPVLETFEPVKLATGTYYKIRHGYGSAFDILFTKLEDATSVAKMTLGRSESDWHCGREFAILKDDLAIETVELPSEDQKAAASSALVQEKQKRDRNEKMTSEFNTASKKCDEACERIWKDWHGCRACASGHQKIIDTFKEYQRLAGDDVVAAKFLAKAFGKTAIVEAFEWFGLSTPEIVEDTKAEQPKPEQPLEQPF